MKQFVAILLFVFGLPVQADAQSFLGNLKEKTSGSGTVTVNQSADIDELVDNVRLDKGTNKPVGKQGDVKDVPPKSGGNVKTSGDNRPASAPQKTRPNENDSEGNSENHSKKVIANSHKVTGYRIQAYAGGNSREDRQKAERISGAIKARFPDVPVYVHFYSPRWICRVGNFRTYEDAAKMLKEIKAMGYTQACIVKGKINVRY